MSNKILAVIISILVSFQFQPAPVQAQPLPQSGNPDIDCTMGILAVLSSNAAEARALLEPAFETLKANPDSNTDTLLTCGLNLAVLFQAELQLNRALEIYEFLLPISQELGDGQSEWTIYFGMSAIYIAQERYDEAKAVLEEALPLSQSSSPWFLEHIKPTAQASTLNNLALTLAGLERRKLRQNWDFSQSKLLLQEALTVSRQKAESGSQFDPLAALMTGPSIEPVILNNIGQIYSDEMNYESAIAHFEGALELNKPAENSFITAGPEFNKMLNVVIYNNLGLTHFRQSEPEQALQYYAQALELAEELDNPLAQAGMLSEIGFIQEQQGLLTEALGNYETAIQLQEQAQAVADNSLMTNVGSGALTNSNALALTGSFGGYNELYDHTVRAYYKAGLEADQQDDPAKSQRLLAQSFYTSEQNRARLFLRLLTTRQLQLTDEKAVLLLQQERERFADLVATQRNLKILTERNSAEYSHQIQQLEAELARIEPLYQETLTTIQSHRPELMSLISGHSNVLSVTEVQALLDEETTLVSYYTLGDEGILAFIISADDFTVMELADLSRLDLRATLNSWLSAIRFSEKNLEIAHPAELQTIYQQLIEPIFDQIETAKLSIVAHNELHYIPFAGLSNGQQYLSEQFILTNLPSASTLPFIQGEPESVADTATSLILGDPTSDLPFAQKEAEEIGAILGSPVYLTNQATESLIWREAEAASIIHAAAHGEFDHRIPLDSTVKLAEGDGHDGSLKVREIFDLQLSNAELVTLSACQTSLAQSVTSEVGRISAGDEIVSLNRAFFFAGAPTVLSSLWNVNDESTALLMTEFYRQWQQQGKSKAEALQAAQALVREQYPNPYFWAAFVLSGAD